jgi:hypothetical protein
MPIDAVREVKIRRNSPDHAVPFIARCGIFTPRVHINQYLPLTHVELFDIQALTNRRRVSK